MQAQRLGVAGNQQPLPGAEMPCDDWLRRYFPAVCTAPFAERHRRLWAWFEALESGHRPRPRVEVWPRGGAKSSSAELGCVRVGVKLARRFALYVSETQEQADKHVQSIAAFFDAVGVERLVSKYGHSKGWRHDQLRTANGFNVAAIGLDVATRGVKLDQYRPDLILFDDVDNQTDTGRTIEKKIAAITTAIIPAGSPDCAVLFLQNLIHEESIVAQLADGRADFLHDREPACVEPAVRGLQTESVDRADGLKVYRITGGEATWAGQSLAVCERQLNDWGRRAFLREAQHQVEGGDGYFFNVGALGYIAREDLPADLRWGRAWDLAGTQDGGNWTVGIHGAVRGRVPNAALYLADVCRGQWSSDRVRSEIARCRERDPQPSLLRLPQDGGQAGKDQAEQFRQQFPGAIIRPVTGDKATRARGVADAMGRGNVYVVRDPGGSIPEWDRPLRRVLRLFREDVTDQEDDEVDALSDLWNELAGKRAGDVF